jgi:DNA-binding response OmpR family regulator
MMTQLKLKVLAFGSQMMLRRLATQIDTEDISVIGCVEAAKAANFLSEEDFDLVIVDSLLPDSQTICQNAANLTSAPVTLMLRETAADWKKLRNLGVDGFLPEEAGNAELIARIRAYCRRKPVSQTEQEENLVIWEGPTAA